MNTFDHFAYGSNLSTARLRARCPSAIPIAVGYIRGRALRFHKRGRDGTAKADAYFTGNPTDLLWGVVYRCDLAEKETLDRCESLGCGYDLVEVRVQANQKVLHTRLYEAMPQAIDTSLVPAPWYFDHVMTGAREHGLPSSYLRMLAGFAAVG
ncbi:gamma-glutamylcyclotransferase family protein [Roseimaritima sediminicola]|uniref:gamma-glutamylcyclotransferase family protein n=1 Tax=Roseimaritima sediminicola TaxID=2662066 RepID=UPI0012984B94|nr:gamma-glutamylcyclotransferase family protein [Roseimaritima sediminicola]